MTPKLKRFADSDELYAMIDGKVIARKSIYTAEVYPDNNIDTKLTTYQSRLQHCGSCMGEREYGYAPMDECCCIHSSFHSKKEENEYVKSTGFWKLTELQS